MIEWLAMGGHGFYVWSAYGMLVLALVIELLALRRGRRLSQLEARSVREAFADSGGHARPSRPAPRKVSL